ncbi:hypothetical protein HO173_008985 [Letharia columbiana]|uniref:EKC/KEOPS complex subunit BUD32 n=1 Tax=Letharia columbiana TaxID=112416 RepID=A0A8H6FQD3_9LECA|nr:uncharacterized protein HO173_008985 [Letharia columbiana]KAF6232771.1 hypothetical protein HO173_008985 [Letharia columbiana]
MTPRNPTLSPPLHPHRSRPHTPNPRRRSPPLPHPFPPPLPPLRSQTPPFETLPPPRSRQTPDKTPDTERSAHTCEVPTGGRSGGWMMMEWVEGSTVKEVVVEAGKRIKERGGGGVWEEGLRALMGKIGRALGRMHEVGVVHGDLTTSNMMLRPAPMSLQHVTTFTNGAGGDGDDAKSAGESLEGEIVLIDFGLAAQSLQDEDKAVDLYVLERAFGSTHPEAEEGFQEVLRVYGESYKGAKVVLKRLEDVRLRGRKRSMLG